MPTQQERMDFAVARTHARVVADYLEKLRAVARTPRPSGQESEDFLEFIASTSALTSWMLAVDPSKVREAMASVVREAMASVAECPNCGQEFSISIEDEEDDEDDDG